MDKKFLALIAIPIMVISGFILLNLQTVMTGNEILLEVVRPVDPVDLFRGNYVILNYGISSLNKELVKDGSDFKEGDTLYATLSKKEKFWTADAIYRQKPSLEPGQSCMKGSVRFIRGDNFFMIDWGIESFFVPQEKAKSIEEERNKGNVASIVAADKNCNAVLRSLKVGNETIKTK